MHVRVTCVAFDCAVDGAPTHDLHSLVAAADDDAAVAGVETIDVHAALRKHPVSDSPLRGGDRVVTCGSCRGHGVAAAHHVQ